MLAKKQEKRLGFIIDCLFLAVVLAIIWLSAKYLLFLFLPFVLGFVFAAVIQPVVRLLNKKYRINQKFSSVFMVLAVTAIILLAIVFLSAKIVESLTMLTQSLPQLLSSFAYSLEQWTDRLTAMLKCLPAGARGQADLFVKEFLNEVLKFSNFVRTLQPYLMNIVQWVPGFLLDSVITVVVACFIAADYPDVKGFILRQMPQSRQQTFLEIKKYCMTSVAGFIRAYLILMFITFCELAAGLWLLRVQGAILIALLISFVDVLPVLGTGAVMVPWIVIEFVVGNTYLGGALTILYAIITIIRNIIEPKIVGKHIGLNPLVTLFAMYAGLKLFGVTGLILAPIAVIVLIHLHRVGKLNIWK